MKWSTVLFTGSIGIRTTGVQLTPSTEVVITRSLVVQPGRKRQSDHTTYTRPLESTSTEGRKLEDRRFPAVLWLVMGVTTVTGLHVCPPLVDRNAMICVANAFEAGMITVALGWETGIPPRPDAAPVGDVFGPQVRPPSLDVLTSSRLPRPKSSHVV